MNWDIIKGKWREIRGEARQKWGKLIDSDWDQIAGKKDELIGRLQKYYGYGKDEASREVDDFVSSQDVSGGEKRKEKEPVDY